MLPGDTIADSSRHAAPVIGITCGHATTGSVPRVRTNRAYLRAVESAGGVPVVLAPFGTEDAAAAATAVMARLDGLLLTGGEDVDPARYGAEPHPATEPPDRLRDATEIALVRAARERRIPLLAICRGVQVLNVALGGTLVQDIPSECGTDVAHSVPEARDARCHPVSVAPGSRLAAALGATALPVNSMHHQAPALTGAPLRVVATAPHGLTEGLESEDADWWAVGVQWHPEELTGTEEPWDRALFEAFVREARASMGRAPD